MFAYCGNNPISRADHRGNLYELISKRITDFCLTAKKLLDSAVDSALTSYYLLEGLPTSPVKHAEYKNTAASAKYGAARSGGRTHKGVDYYPVDGTDRLYGSDGTPRNIYAMKDGEVVDYMVDFYAGTAAVVINHGDFYALYGEISTNLRVGDTVKQGQIIGKMKLSTDDTLMLHLEIFKGGYDDYARDHPYRVDPTYTYELPDWRG